MGNWGVKSYENDEAADALDAGFERVHGELYEELMDDRNPLTFEQVQQRLADTDTLEAAIETLQKHSLDPPGAPETWDELARLAVAGIVVRHAELGCRFPNHGEARPSTGSKTKQSSGTRRRPAGSIAARRSHCSNV